MARRQNNISFPRTNSKIVIYTGGVNEGITSLELGAGDLQQCYNYEEIDGAFHGYSSVQGYERFDGQPSPTDVNVEFLEDEGNDGFSRVVLESLESTDIEDKSEFEVPSTQSNLEFNTTRFQLGEGSWRFNSLVDSKWTFAIPTGSIDYSVDEYTFDGIMQISDNFVSTVVLCEVPGVIKIQFEEGIPKVYLTTTSGVETFTATSLMSSGRWSHFSVVVFPGATTDVYVGLNGTNIDKFTSTGAAVNADADLIVGNGTDSTRDLYLDQFRLSKTYRWKSTVEYEYEMDKAFSDFKYFIFNADDEDRENVRAVIGKVEETPDQCENGVRDVHIFEGVVYATRDKTGGASGGVFQSSASGWVELTNSGWRFDYNNGTTPSGDLFNRAGEPWTASGGATGTIRFVTINTGDYTHGTPANQAVGSALVDITTGTLTNGDVITLTNFPSESMTLTADAESTQVGAGPAADYKDGRFAYFPGESPNKHTLFFIANQPGVFYYNDTAPMGFIHGPKDAEGQPTHLALFKDRLWLVYPDGHLFYSAPGDPTNWSSEFGAGEIFFGDEITNLETAPGDTMIVSMDETIKLLKASQPSTATIDYPFFIEDFATSSGAYANSMASLLGDVYFCDDRGPTNMSQSDSLSGFSMGDLKKKAHITYQSLKTSFIGSYVQRTKSQFRIHFHDTAIDTTKCVFYTFSEKKIKGVTLVEYPAIFTRFHEGEDPDGSVFIVGGAEDGFVYWMDRGESFDGDDIKTALKTAYYHYGTPRLWKRFFRVLFEISSANKMVFSVRGDFNYSNSQFMSGIPSEFTTDGKGGVWGQSIWSDFIWGGSIISNPMLYLNGYGHNMSIEVSTTSRHQGVHTLHNMVVDYANGSRYM